MEYSSIEERFNKIKSSREDRLEGKMNFIPFFKHFPRFSKYIPGFLPGVMYKLMSQTNIGKSQFSKFLSIIVPYETFKEYNFKYKILYFSLEENKDDFIDKLIVYRIKQKYGIIIDPLKIKSYTSDILSDDDVDKIKSVVAEVGEILENVDIVDNIPRNPTGLYRYAFEKSKEWGIHYYRHHKTNEIVDQFAYETIPDKINWRHHKYETDYLCMLVCDQVNNLALEKDSTSGMALDKRGVLKKWSFEYCRDEFTKKWNWIVFNVQQLTAEGENLEHQKNNKVKPSLDKAGESKEILQDDMIVFSLFNPSRYEMSKCNGYDINIMKDKFREVGVHKNRLGAVGLELGVYFEGASGTFKELPPIKEEAKLLGIYEKIKNGTL
jgi:hypothetical protein